MYKTTLRNLAVCVPLALVSVSAFADLPDFAQLVEKNAPAVVNVQATHNGDSTAQGEIDDQEVPEIFRRFEEQESDPRTELDYASPFELVTAVALSAQATDVS